MTVRAKPSGLQAEYAAQFNDPSIVASYDTRPPYPARLLPLIVDLAGGATGRILDLGCGTGELARRIAPRLRSVTAIDSSERMIARARTLPGGDAANITWMVARVEDAPLSGLFSLALAAESFHWFDWAVVCPLLARCVRSSLLVLVDRTEVGLPWAVALQPLIAAYSTNRDFQPYDLVQELTARACYTALGRTTVGPEVFRQSIDAYITSIHSRNGFSRDRMTSHAARQFDLAVREAAAPHARHGVVELQIETRVVWGPTRCPA